MSLYFPLIGVLGLFNASSQVSSGGGVSHPKGRVMTSDQGLDFTCHPGLPVWENPDSSLHCDVFDTALDVK